MWYTTLNPLQMCYTTLNPLQMCYTTESNSSVLVQCSVPHLHSTYMYVHVHGNSDQCYTVAVMQWVLARLLLVRLSYLCVCVSVCLCICVLSGVCSSAEGVAIPLDGSTDGCGHGCSSGSSGWTL